MEGSVGQALSPAGRSSPMSAGAGFALLTLRRNIKNIAIFSALQSLLRGSSQLLTKVYTGAGSKASISSQALSTDILQTFFYRCEPTGGIVCNWGDRHEILLWYGLSFLLLAWREICFFSPRWCFGLRASSHEAPRCVCCRRALAGCSSFSPSIGPQMVKCQAYHLTLSKPFEGMPPWRITLKRRRHDAIPHVRA